jgi:alpha,alpha-trehalose phosphorylase
VIGDDVFEVHPWSVPERRLDLDLLAQTESIFALSNGHIGLRGNLDEGEPSGNSGTYLNGFHEKRPLPYAEVAYGNPESGETMINVTNGKVLRLLVDDEPFDLRYGTLERHERTLDLRDGVLRREAHWRSPAGQGVILRTTRLVSFVHRSVAAIRYEVETYGGSAQIVVQSELVANEPMRRCGGRWSPSCTGTGACAPGSSTSRRRRGCGSPPGWTTSSTGRRTWRPAPRASPTSRA